MAFNVAEFTADILKDVQIDEAQRQSLAAILNNPVIAKRLEDSTLRQSDYSKKVADVQDKIKKSQDYWDSLVEADKRLRLREAELNGLAGNDPSLNTPDKANKFVDQEELRKLAQQYIEYNSQTTKIAMQHLKEFGEVLDLNDVVKVSSENGGININLAYDKYVQPKREEAQQKKIKELVEKAREEGKKEAEANFTPPTLEAPMGIQNPALDQLSKKTDDRGEFGSMAAVKAWREARTKGTIINTVL